MLNFFTLSAPIDMPVEVQIEKRSSTSIFVNWRGVSTTQLEEPLEGYKVCVRHISSGDNAPYLGIGMVIMLHT